MGGCRFGIPFPKREEFDTDEEYQAEVENWRDMEYYAIEQYEARRNHV